MLLIMGMDVICMLYNIIFMIIYFSKKRVKNFDTIYYSALIVLCCAGLFIEFTMFCQVFMTTTTFGWLVSLYLIWYLVIAISIIFYIFRKSLEFRKVDKEKAMKCSKLYWYIMLPLFIITVIFILSSPNDIVVGQNFAYGVGAKINIIAAWLTTMYVLCIYNLFKYRKVNSKKQNMFYLSIVLFGMGILVCRIVAPYIAVSYILLSMIVTTQYFTIENPDLAVIDEMKRVNGVKQNFLSSMSHEFKTPLNAIVGLSSAHIGEASDAEEDFKIINEQGLILMDMVSNVLDINQLDSNSITLNESDYFVKELFQNIYNTYSRRFASKNIEFNYYVDESIPNILIGDQEKITDIVRNLLSNALKYTSVGSVNLRVSGSVESYIYNLRIEISDTGSGIAENELNNIFNEFSKKESDINSNINGLGLGLSLCRILVNSLKGKLTVSSKEGVGSTFVVEIPQIKK